MAAEVVYREDEDPWDDTWYGDGWLDEKYIWQPEPIPVEEPIIIREAQRSLETLPALRPSQFTAHAFWMPKTDKYFDEQGEEQERVVVDRFSFEGRRHMLRCYDTPARRLLLFCGRQVEKSTLIGNIILCYMSLIPGYKALFVSPSATQTKTFSNDRIKDPIETSPTLKRFTTTMLSQNIFEKQFVNRSKVTLRYAYLNADRTRGIPAHVLAVDEFQDILQDNVPVMRHCLSHAPKHLKREIFSGTPKSLDNHLEYYRANMSTQCEWVVPCDACNHWNILGEKNIGKKGLVCESCSRRINPMHERAQWAAMVADAPWESYRIPQLMVPWLDWEQDILHNYEHDPRDKFYNECLGISYDSGLRPLTTGQLRDICCKSHLAFDDVEKYRHLSYQQGVYAGIDWGTGEHSYTVIFLGTYVDMKFRVIFAHRFTGEEVDPEVQLARIIEIIRYFNVKWIGSDYGGGFSSNYKLIKTFGFERVKQFQYLARSSRGKITWEGKFKRFMVARTEVMSDIFNAMKRGKVEFPNWKEFKDPFGQDMLNIFSEYNEQLKMIQYKHGADKPDDSFHSFLYCWLASMFDHPRPDIIAPDKEDENGFNVQRWTGPIDQG